MHATYLVVGGNELQAVVDAPQVWLLKLHAYVLRDQVNGNHILLPASGSMLHMY